MKRNLRFWSAIISFQILFGVAVFLVTRQIYNVQPDSPATAPVAYPGVTQGAPHPLPRSKTSKAPVYWPGSERITVDDVKRLVATESSENTRTAGGASDMGAEHLAQTADRHFREGFFHRAAEEYAAVMKQAPHNVDVYNNLGLTLHYVGRSAEGVETLRKGIALDPSHQRIWLTLGFVQSGTGATEDARRALNKAIELDSESTIGREAKRLLGELPG